MARIAPPPVGSLNRTHSISQARVGTALNADLLALSGERERDSEREEKAMKISAVSFQLVLALGLATLLYVFDP